MYLVWIVTDVPGLDRDPCTWFALRRGARSPAPADPGAPRGRGCRIEEIEADHPVAAARAARRSPPFLPSWLPYPFRALSGRWQTREARRMAPGLSMNLREVGAARRYFTVMGTRSSTV